jgi:DNA-binding winged helix-turn-helix (wHTH) protein
MDPGLEVGTTSIANAFYAGRYQDVLAQTIDSPTGGADDADVPFAIGALAFAGRIDEAELLLESARRPSARSGRTLAAGAFFLSVALGRAGRSEDSRAVLVRAFRETHCIRDAWARSLLLQGTAAHHFFGARYVRAGRAALRALASAQAAKFAYGQLLANDMRGHVLLRIGRFHEGFAVLTRARDQAKKLELAVNARAIEISLALHRASLAPIGEAIALLESTLAREDAEDSYSKRMILLELATYCAWAGRASRASEHVEAAAPLCAGDARARAALACARAHLARTRSGWAAAKTIAERASAELERGIDPAREVELAAVVLGASLHDGDDTARDRAIEWLRSHVERSSLYRAKAWLAIFGPAELEAAEPDRSFPALHAIARGASPARRAAAAVESGLLGLLPEALALDPGTRIHLRDGSLVLEEHGEVVRLPAPAPRSQDVLFALGVGPCDRQALLASVWGIRSYRPERHDSVIKTTVSRLRAALGDRGAWIETAEGRYRLREGVEVVRRRDVGAAPIADLGEPSRHAGSVRRHARWQRVIAELSREGEATVSELARRLHTSIRTMSRDLSEMHEADLVARAGGGRATRYRVKHDGSAVRGAA